MTDLDAPFEPDWVSPPGDTIRDLMEEYGWSETELAARLRYSVQHVRRLLDGEAVITKNAAVRLARVLGSTSRFWLAREALYREDLVRLGMA